MAGQSGASTEPLLGETSSSHYCVLVEDADQTSLPQDGVTVPQAVFNLVNIYVGIGLLAMPFALALSGWLGLLALAGTTGLFCFSGKLLIRAFEKVDSNSPQTYPALGVAALGPKGRYIVAGFAVSEFFGGSCVMIIVLWQQLVVCLPHGGLFGVDPFHIAVLAMTIAVLPLLFIPSFKGLSWLSLIGCCSTVVVVVTVALVVAFDPLRTHMPQQPPPRHELLRMGIIQAAGIFAVSVSGHSSLPAQRNSMRKPQEFNTVLNAGFGAMLLIYAVVGGAGYWYFGSLASELITTDLALNAPFSGRSLLIPGVTVDRIVAGCVLINAYTTYPCLILVIQDMVWSVLPFSHTRHGGARSPLAAVATAFRVAVFLAGSGIAFGAYNVLGNVMSLVGGICSMCCSLMLPSSFFLLLYWRTITPLTRAAGIGLLLGGILLLVLITCDNILDILHKLRTSAHVSGTLQLPPLLYGAVQPYHKW